MSHPGEDRKWSSSLSSSPVLLVLQRVEAAYHSGDGALGFPCPRSGDAYGLLDRTLLGAAQHRSGAPTQAAGPRRHVTHLVTLALQRHVLAMARDYTVCVKSASDLVVLLCDLLERPPLGTAQLGMVCGRLRDQIQQTVAFQRKVQGDPWLHLHSPVLLRTTRDMQRTLAQHCIQAAVLAERCIESVLRMVAHAPMQETGELVPSLTLYNQAVSEIWRWSDTWRRPQMYPAPRVVKLLAEVRGHDLARSFCLSLCKHGLEEVIGTEMDDANQWQSSGILCRCREDLGVLLLEERRYVSALLETLAWSDRSMRHHEQDRLKARRENDTEYGECDTVASLLACYSTHVWSSFCSHIYHAFYGGLKQPKAFPALSSSGQAAALRVIDALNDILASALVPDLCRTESHQLIAHLLSTHVIITWDQMLCEALSSALTDKCVAVTSVVAQPLSDVSSRTARILRSLCCLLSSTLCRQDVVGLDAEDWCLCRCVASLQICELWLRTRTQLFVCSGTLSHLVLLTYGDLPVLREEAVTLCTQFHQIGSKTWLLSHKLCLQIQTVRSSMEVLPVSLPHSLGLTCDRLARDFFQRTMPSSQHWRGRFSSGPAVTPSDYALCAAHAMLAPVLDCVGRMPVDRQVSALTLVLSRFMEAWMGHVLREKLRFSLQGALQLRCDFESVRSFLQSPCSALPPEVIEAAMSLPVFQQSENAVACLLQQPSHKSYVSPRGCPLSWCCSPLCTASVESVSDSLQSLDSLERRAWTSHHSANVAQHSHDSYLPHSQRQWLSLRVQKQWGGLHLPWEVAEPSES